MDIKETNHRAVILQLIKEKLGKYALWTRVESRLAILCAGLPEATGERDRKQMVISLNEIKQFLISSGVVKEELKFLDEEVERYEKTKQISLYDESENELEEGLINKYAGLSLTSEGVVGIHLGLNYKQLRKLTNGVFNKTGLV